MEVQNRILITVAVTLLWTSCVPADLINEETPLLPPLVQNIDVDEPSYEPIGDLGPAVIDDATDADLDGLHVPAGVSEYIGADGDDDDDESTLFSHLTFAPSSSPPPPSTMSGSSIYDHDFTVKDLNGNDVHLSMYKGRVLLIVNYANFCGLTTRNERQLSKMAKKYGPRGLTILMFPSNCFFQNYGGDESGMSLKKRYPEFEVFSMISVNGESTHPLYTFLKETTPTTRRRMPKFIKWNFTKFLVDQNGNPIARYGPLASFSSIKKGIKRLLEPQQNIS